MVDVARTAAAVAVVAILCSVLYSEFYASFSAARTRGFVFPSAVPAAGLEDVNFFTLLSESESAMRESCFFAVFLCAMTLDSHVAMVGLFAFGGPGVDILFFGADEAVAELEKLDSGAGAGTPTIACAGLYVALAQAASAAKAGASAAVAAEALL